MKADLSTLAAVFRDENPFIQQGNGYAIYPRSRKDINTPLTKEQEKALRKVASHCGMCVAAIAADHFKVAPTSLSRGALTSAAYCHLARLLGPENTPRYLPIRHFTDGIEAIHAILSKGKDFKNWCRRNKDRGLCESEETAIYLEEVCGAPRDCFNGRDWPPNIKPETVFQNAHDFNFA